MTRKKNQSIPLERLFLDEGLRRNFDLLQGEAIRNEKLISAFKDELLRNAKANILGKDGQRAKATLDRGKAGIRGDDDRTMKDLIAELAKEHMDEKPQVLWLALKEKIEDWAGECDLKIINEGEKDAKQHYEYPFLRGRNSERKAISYKQFRDRLRDARKELKAA